MNVNSGAIEDRFHYFVRPTLNPVLSSYCINLTGITQALINRQEEFPVIYNKFINWLRKLQSEMGLEFTSNEKTRTSDGPNATFCSWTNWDLNYYFRIDCERNGISCPKNLMAWIDISELFEVNIRKNYFYFGHINIVNVISFLFSLKGRIFHERRWR